MEAKLTPEIYHKFSAYKRWKMNNDDINDYLPSILNPRAVKKPHGNLTLTQNSVVSRCSLSLKKRNGTHVNKALHRTFPPGKENVQNKNNSIDNFTKQLNKRYSHEDISIDFSLAQEPRCLNGPAAGKENVQNVVNSPSLQKSGKSLKRKTVYETSIGFSAVEDIHTELQDIESSPPICFEYELPIKNNHDNSIILRNNKGSLSVKSSATELEDNIESKNTTSEVRQIFAVSFGVIDCETLNISSNNSNIKNIVISRMDSAMNVECEVVESSQISVENSAEVISISSDEDAPPPKKPAVAVNIEIKKQKLTDNESSKVLILNTDAIKKLSHVIVQPPHYKTVKRKIATNNKNKFKTYDRNSIGSIKNAITLPCGNLKQKRIDSYFVQKPEIDPLKEKGVVSSGYKRDVAERGDVAMNGNMAGEGAKHERALHSRSSTKREKESSPSSASPQRLSPRPVASRSSEPRRRSETSRLSKERVDSIHFNLPRSPGATVHRNATNAKTVPYHKFVAGTNFVVDAFSYGDIPNVKHYFLTHFHSDHYSGLKRSFDKTLYCSKITADLCVTRLGVNPKNICVINIDEPITIENVEVTAVDANHCPGAVMLVFSLPGSTNILHTGDFRASPEMESYPVFWNKDIHSIYLDTTYCNPRYDFPTQDQCLELALYLLRQKKLALEKMGKKFASVLIVCGTYTIGKEKFFLGVARRVGCNVWACAEKDKVLRAVEGRGFNTHAPHACQLHVVPMRDITHEKLRRYLESLKGAFSEVVAFKPSGWETGKDAAVERDSVTIHGIPYSEHSSFSEMLRFVKYLRPRQVVPTVDVSGGFKAVQKFFPCPLVSKESAHSQSRVTDYFSIQNRPHVPAVT